MGNFKAYTKDWATVELYIPIDEIVREYRLAKNKSAQIDILAEQCGVKPCRIAWILDRCGLPVNVRKKPRERRNPNTFDYVAHWENSMDAVICDRIRQQLERMNEVEEMENELTKELVRKGAPLEDVQGNECVEELKRLRHIKPEKEPESVVEIPAGPPAEVADHGVYRIVGELWSIYLDKLRERGVVMLGTVEVLKMHDLERIVHEIVEGM